MTAVNRHMNNRRGAVAAFVALLLIPMLALVALAVDYGYILVVRTDLQRAADHAALAAVQELIPAADGTQDEQAARDKVREFSRYNTGDANFSVRDADIEIGRYNPTNVYNNFQILQNGTYDTVRVTLRRDDVSNSPVSLFFARIIGITESQITASATAVLQKGSYLPPGADVLPFAVPQHSWDTQGAGDSWSIYGDGRLEDDTGAAVPGNWGTLDIGSASNSTSELADQIRNGLTQADLTALHSTGTISSDEHIDAGQTISLNADTGLSSGLRYAVTDSHGTTKVVPIFDTVSDDGGNNVMFEVVGWGVVEVVDSHWAGARNTRIEIRKSFMYDGDLKAQPDLGSTTGVIDGAFTSPVLVQ